jgi:ABC-type spermidine/putrescine transport system permease subunit II
MSVFTVGDICFIVFILCVIHGIMLAVGRVRRRKKGRDAESAPG